MSARRTRAWPLLVLPLALYFVLRHHALADSAPTSGPALGVDAGEVGGQVEENASVERAEDEATDASEPVDCDFDCHNFRFRFCVGNRVET